MLMSATVATGTLAATPVEATPQAPETRTPVSSASQFAIAPGSLDVVLAEFERTTGLKTALAMPELGVIQSPGVTGRLTPADAMTALLQGTSVVAVFGDGRVDLAVDRVREFVEVSGRTAPTVSSPRYTAPLRDIPQTIAVIPKAVIESQGATTLSDALRNVPGITLQAGEGGGASNTAGDMFNMRGFNASNSLFVDGVRDDGLIARDVFNLEQIEVFMGPTGSDVGRGTAAGYVNMQTKTPHMDPTYWRELLVRRRRSIAVDDRLQLGAGRPRAGRLVASDGRAPEHAVAGRWRGRSRFRRGTRARPSRRHSDSASAPRRVSPWRRSSSRQDGLPDYGIPGAAWAREPLAPTTVQTASPVDQTNFYGSVGYDYDRAKQDSVTLRAEHDLGRQSTLRYQSRYNHTHREAAITDDSERRRVRRGNQPRDARAAGQRAPQRGDRRTSSRLVDRFATGGARHAANIGVDLQLEDQFAPVIAGLGTRAPVDVYAPNPFDPVAGYAPARSGAFTRGETATVGIYAFDTVDLGSRWQATGGARWERYDTSFRNVDATGAATVDLSAQDSLVSGKAGLVFRATEQGNLYVGYGTSVTPPGTANFTLSAQANNQNNPSVKPQRSSNVEARRQVGSCWRPRHSHRRGLPHDQRERHLHGGRDVDSTALQPGRSPGCQRRHAAACRARSRRAGSCWRTSATSIATLETQNSANQGKRLVLTPEFSGSIWSTYRLPRGVTVGGGVRSHQPRLRERGQYDCVAGVPRGGRPGGVCRQLASEPAVEPVQPHQRALCPQREQQRWPLQPRSPAIGDAHDGVRLLVRGGGRA